MAECEALTGSTVKGLNIRVTGMTWC